MIEKKKQTISWGLITVIVLAIIVAAVGVYAFYNYKNIFTVKVPKRVEVAQQEKNASPKLPIDNVLRNADGTWKEYVGTKG